MINLAGSAFASASPSSAGPAGSRPRRRRPNAGTARCFASSGVTLGSAPMCLPEALAHDLLVRREQHPLEQVKLRGQVMYQGSKRIVVDSHPSYRPLCRQIRLPGWLDSGGRRSPPEPGHGRVRRAETRNTGEGSDLLLSRPALPGSSSERLRRRVFSVSSQRRPPYIRWWQRRIIGPREWGKDADEREGNWIRSTRV